MFYNQGAKKKWSQETIRESNLAQKINKIFVWTSLDFPRLTLERPLQSFTSGEEIKIGTKSYMDRPHKYLRWQLGDHI